MQTIPTRPNAMRGSHHANSPRLLAGTAPRHPGPTPLAGPACEPPERNDGRETAADGHIDGHSNDEDTPSNAVQRDSTTPPPGGEGVGEGSPGSNKEIVTYARARSKSQAGDIFNNEISALTNRSNRQSKSCAGDLLNTAESYCSLTVGDIVKTPIPGSGGVMYEGVIISSSSDGNFNVDFGEGDVVEKLPRQTMYKTAGWNMLEVGDIVQARPSGEWSFYEAHIVGVDFLTGTYTVEWRGDDSTETQVPMERIRKLTSNRTRAVALWRKGFNAVKASIKMMNLSACIKTAAASMESGVEAGSTADDPAVEESPLYAYRRISSIDGVKAAAATEPFAQWAGELPGAQDNET